MKLQNWPEFAQFRQHVNELKEVRSKVFNKLYSHVEKISSTPIPNTAYDGLFSTEDSAVLKQLRVLTKMEHQIESILKKIVDTCIYIYNQQSEILLQLSHQEIQQAKVILQECQENLYIYEDIVLFAPKCLQLYNSVKGYVTLIWTITKLLSIQHMTMVKSDRKGYFFVEFSSLVEAHEYMTEYGKLTFTPCLAWTLCFSSIDRESIKGLYIKDKKCLLMDIYRILKMAKYNNEKLHKFCVYTYGVISYYECLRNEDALYKISFLTGSLEKLPLQSSSFEPSLLRIQLNMMIWNYIYMRYIGGSDIEVIDRDISIYKNKGVLQEFADTSMTIKSLYSSIYTPITLSDSISIIVYLFTLRKAMLCIKGVLPWYMKILTDKLSKFKDSFFIEVYVGALSKGVNESELDQEEFKENIEIAYNNIYTYLNRHKDIYMYNLLLKLTCQDRLLSFYEMGKDLNRDQLEVYGQSDMLGSSDDDFQFHLGRNGELRIIGGVEMEALHIYMQSHKDNKMPNRAPLPSIHQYTSIMTVLVHTMNIIDIKNMNKFDICRLVWYFDKYETRGSRYHGLKYINKFL